MHYSRPMISIDLLRYTSSCAEHGGGDESPRAESDPAPNRPHGAVSRGRIARRIPSASVTRASADVKTFDTPRVEPGPSVSPTRGYSSPEVVTPSAPSQ